MGDEISVPSICLSVTLPDQDAIDCADRQVFFFVFD